MQTQLIEKLQKLLAKAQNSATTPEESATFMAKVQQMMLEHNLDYQALEQKEEIESGFDPLDQTKTKWKQGLACFIASFHGCMAYIALDKSIVIVGKPKNVSIARMLYLYCSNEIERLSKELCKGRGKSFANNFKVGCMSAIIQAMKNERENQKRLYHGNENALIVINQYENDYSLSKSFVANSMNLKTKKSGVTANNRDAYSSGFSAGSGIYGNFGKNRLSY